MRILVNDTEVTGVGDDLTLGGALAYVQENNIADEHVISAIWLDDEPLTAERLSIWKDRPVSDFSEARIEAPSRRSLAAQGLSMIAEGLSASAHEREAIAKALRQGQTAEAMEQMSGYLRVWNSVQQTVASVCRLFGIDTDTFKAVGEYADPLPQAEIVKQNVTALSAQLQELKDALENGDILLVADILDYEFGDMTEQWNGLLNDLAAHFQD